MTAWVTRSGQRPSRRSYVLVVGEKEREGKTISVRSRDHGERGEMTIESFMESLEVWRR